MTKEEALEKYRKTLKEIADIEFTADKTRRQRWRELQKIKKWLETVLNYDKGCIS